MYTRKIVVGALGALAMLAASLTAATAPAAANGDFDRVITLGDSYASGIGIHKHETSYDDHGPDNHSFWGHLRLGASTCKREDDTNHGAQLASWLGVPQQLIACGGAETAEMANQLGNASIPGNGDRTLIVITIGGNDIRSNDGKVWPEVLERCILWDFSCEKRWKNQTGNFSTITNRVRDVYTDIVNQYPAATLRVVGYPEIMQRSPGCFYVTGIDRNEADWVDSQIRSLNSALVSGVNQARNNTGGDIEFVSVASEFDDHGACRKASERYVNDKVLGYTYKRTYDWNTHQVTHHYNYTGLKTSSSSFHPTQKGYDAFYRAVKASL